MTFAAIQELEEKTTEFRKSLGLKAHGVTFQPTNDATENEKRAAEQHEALIQRTGTPKFVLAISDADHIGFYAWA